MNPSASETARARLTVAELANAARSGPVGPATILSYVARLQKHLVLLGDCEQAADLLVNEALAEERARHEAIAAGTVIPFPFCPRIYTGHGGNAA